MSRLQPSVKGEAMSELWRSSFQEIRDDFKQAGQQHQALRCLLVQYPGSEPEGKPAVRGFGDGAPACWFRHDYAFQKPHRAPDGSLEDGARRLVEIHGDKPAAKAFLQLANEVGLCLDDLPIALKDRFLVELPPSKNPAHRWIHALFDVGWQRVPSSLLKIDKWAWTLQGDAPIRLPHEPGSRQDVVSKMMLDRIDRIRGWERFYSTLDNLFAAADAAIGILLSAEDANQSPK